MSFIRNQTKLSTVNCQKLTNMKKQRDTMMFNVNITKLTPMHIIGLPNTGSYRGIYRAFTERYQRVTKAGNPCLKTS
ncbi:hypothetical protein AV650_16665 [Serratia fonticola]|nr:hypothetical protein AV650_16665 [Serratia fonticola]